MDVSETVQRLVRAINAHDVAGILRQVTDDHLFVDALGSEVRGRQALANAWARYFDLVPDYLIVCEHVLTRDALVGLYGSASGSCAREGAILGGSAWTIPFSALGRVEDGRVAEWRIFCDNEPLRAILAGL